MEITKNGFVYTVIEKDDYWLAHGKGQFDLKIKIPKFLCQSENDVEEYIKDPQKFVVPYALTPDIY